MRIVVVIFSLLAIFMMTMSLMTNAVKNKTDNVKTKIEKWSIDDNRLGLELLLYIDEPLFFSKKLNCKTYDKNKELLSVINKTVEVEAKKTKRVFVDVGRVKGDVKYIDCNFIKN